jgi:hypothetical protein
MYVHVHTDAPRWRGTARCSYRGWRRRFATLAAALGSLLSVAAFGVASAAANEYTGMLAPGTIGVGGASAASGGFVYGSYSWSAPAGANFAGFAYTSAAFSVISDNSVGGISVGFGGDGTANQPSILFPWTNDCSITNVGHYWTRTLDVAGLTGKQACSTSGNTSGWNYANAEIDNTAPGTNPQAEYHTLWLTAFCQAGTCNYDSTNEWGSGSGSVTNLSATVDDPNNQPGGSAYWTVNNGSSWYQTDSSSPAINVNAADPAGVCAIGAWLTGPGSYYVQLANASPGMENPGGPVGNEFDSITPCPGSGGSTVSGGAALAANLASGTYSLAIVASNPGNWEGGVGLSNAPTIASYGNAINIDDTVPTISWANTGSAWTSSTSEQFTVTTGPSGTSGVSCTDNGTAVAATLLSGTTYSVATDDQGTNAMSCSASNDDANGALTGTSATTFDVDTTVPVVSFADTGYTAGTWTNAVQTVTVSATGGPSGIKTVSCLVDGNSAPLVGPSSNKVTISGNGEHVLDCTATSSTNVVGEATYDVWVDTRQPTVTFSGAQPSPAWLSGTPTVVVIGGEQGGTLSGVTRLVCTVNGGSPITLNVDAAQDYTSSFVLTANGADVVSCQATDAAGTTGPATSETVNVDNPDVQPASASLTRYGSSPNIDGGADPFTDGPSQTTWYRDPRPVTITANNTGGGAGIASISCTGAELGGGTTGTWPIDSLNADSQGGERVKVTVQPPGGDLACTATDTAGNVYALGSYEFEIDDTAPAGAFVTQLAWPEPEEVELHVTDSGSGVQFVRVYAQPNGGGKAIDLGFAQYEKRTKDYVVNVDDGTMTPGEYTFYANVADNAGNTGQITASPNGGAEQLQLPLRQDTAVTLQAASVAGVQDAAAPSVLAPALGAAASTSTSTGKTVAYASRRTSTASVARTDAEKQTANCRASKHGSGKCSKAKAEAVLKVPYGKAVPLTGVLRRVKRGGHVIAHAKIDVYQEINGTSKISLLGKTTTNVRGRYSYRVKGGASRLVFAVYHGTKKLRSAVSQLPENFSGSVTLNTNRVTAGGWLLLTGAVNGGHIPTGGVDVTVHYCQVGLPGCGQFDTIRTTTNGTYSFKQYFTEATKGLRYRLWVTVPPGQPGWPYDGATSPKVVRQVV